MKRIYTSLLLAIIALVGGNAWAQTTWQFVGNTAVWAAEGITLNGGNQYDENANAVASGGVTFTGTSGFVSTAKGIGFNAIGSTEDENISIIVPAGYKASVSIYTSNNRTVVANFGEETQTFNAAWATTTKEFSNAEGVEDITLYLYCNQNPGGSNQKQAPFLEKIELKNMASVKSFTWSANAVATINGQKTTIKTYSSGEAEVDEGSQYSVTVDKLIKFGDVYYELNDEQFAENTYGKSFTMGAAAPTHEFTYQAIENVAFYGEVEDIFSEGLRANKMQNIVALSNGGGYTGQGTEGYVKLAFNIPSDGKYKLILGMNNTNDKSRGFNYAIDDADVSETITVNAGTAFVQEIENQTLIAGEHTMTLNITYSLTPIFDYLLIVKTGEGDADVIAFAEAKAALQAAIDEAKAIDTTDKEGVDALNTAIEAAETALTAENATVESLTAAKEELAKAVKAFEDANKPVLAIANADFSESTPIDNHLCGYGKDMAGNNTTYYGMQDITGWNKVVVSGDDATAAYPNSGVAGAVFAYGSEWQMKGNSKAAPAAGPEGNTGNALGFFAVWGCGGYYYQDVILAAGTYTLTIPMYNQSGTQANESYTGFFVNDSDVKYTVAVNPAVGQWTLQSVTFTLEEETAGQIRLGYKSTGSGSGANAMLFIDGVRLQSELDAAIDAYNIALLAAQTAATDEYVTGVEKNALNEAIAANSNIDFTSLAAVKAATDALNFAVATFNEARAHYVAFANSKALVELNKWIYADAEKKTAVELAMRAVAGSADEAKTMNTALLQAYRAYIESNANAEGVEGAEVIASAIQNPRAEAGTNGWTATGNGSIGIKDGTAGKEEPWTDAEGNSAYKYFDGGNWGANAWDVNFAQDITLGAGKYVLSAIMRASTNVDMKLFAGTDSVKAEVVGSAGNVFDRGWNYSFVEFEVAAEGTVNIGVRGVTSNVHEWMSFSDFRLVRIEKYEEPFTAEYGTLWKEGDPTKQTEHEVPFTYIELENKYFKGLAKVGDTIRVSYSKVGNQPEGTRPLVITTGELNLLIDNAGGHADIQQGTSSYDFVLNADEIANIEAENGAKVVLSWRYLTVVNIELLEQKAEIDPTLLADAEQLASDASAVAVGKLLAAIEAYKKDGIAETLQNAITQFKTDNADQEADQTAKVKTDGWKKFDGTAAGVCATQFAPAITTYDGRTANLAEVFENNGNRTGTIIYQDITGLTNGKYKVGFYGNAFSTSVRDGFECTMEDGATDVAYVFANEEKAYITARIATSTTENDFRQFDVEVTDGVIKLGMGKDTEKSTNWHTMQIYQLTWFTTAKELFAAAQVDLKATIEAAKALKNNYRTKGLDAFNEAIAEAEKGVDSNWYNNSEIQTLIDNLKNAMKEFRAANYFTVDDNYAAYIMDAENITEVIETENYKFMAAGHDYGTRGIVSAYGLDLTFEPAGNNMYYLNSQVSNGGNDHYLGSNLYMDAPASAWAFESVLGGFTITNGTQYISIDANDNLVLSDTPHTWAITAVSNMESLRKSALAEAKPEAPVDATFLLQNPNFNRNDQRVAAWVVSEDCTNKNLNGGNQVNNCAESFHSTFTISQTITDAPKGTYMMTAQGFYRQDTNDANEEITEDAPVFFAEAKAYTTSEVPVKTGEENSMSAASESFTAGLYTCEPVEIHVGDNGMLTVGVQGTASYQWVIFDNFRLTYYGITTTDAITEVNTKAENGVKTIYNLNGQKVEKAKKGLYIINGKKTVVK